MGIAGILNEIGPGERVALVKVASDHFVAHQRPLRLAIDIQIWLFQIQSSKGGTNPAVRTFYYRLLRLLSHNIHPIFIFDGPNKPKFKRNKRVGGPGVKVATVPEVLAKQLMNAFGFPWRIAPGEAEAECALLQKEGIVDAVLSDDADTLMFGSGLTLRNWKPDPGKTTPTHVDVYKAQETLDKSGLDREGMILVALMSGGDYIVEGIPRCGPKTACDAARAGFGRELCEISKRRDVTSLRQWRERLQHELCSNESKFFSRKNSKLVIPDDFPNREVLGYYTNPCVSTSETLARLRNDLKWDQNIDFASLRIRVGEIFDWVNLGGAKYFIRNIAPKILVRQLRLHGKLNLHPDGEMQQEREGSLVRAIHGKRNHGSTDQQLEYRVSYIPANLVPIDLSQEEPDDDFVPAGGADELIDSDDEWATATGSTQIADDITSSPKKRKARPFDSSEPERCWILATFLIAGCPSMVDAYEELLLRAKNPLQARQRNKSKTSAPKSNTKTKDKKNTRSQSAILTYTKVVKAGSVTDTFDKESDPISILASVARPSPPRSSTPEATFRLPSTQTGLLCHPPCSVTVEDGSSQRTTGGISTSDHQTDTVGASNKPVTKQDISTPPRQRKRRSPEPITLLPSSQKTIESCWSRTSSQVMLDKPDIIDLLSSPVRGTDERQVTPSPQPKITRPDGTNVDDFILEELPATVTKRRKKTPLRRYDSAPACLDELHDETNSSTIDPNAYGSLEIIDLSTNDALDLASPVRTDILPSPSTILRRSPRLSLNKPSSSLKDDVLNNRENQDPGNSGAKDLGQKLVQNKRYIRFRGSLAGTWTTTSSSPVSAIKTSAMSTARYEMNEVEIIDLS